ncbi:MAG: glycosyltransferase [Gammaproteobacteria bacterium]|nr:glycosyltransferase [Gammaproteobacteria bacterium]
MDALPTERYQATWTARQIRGPTVALVGGAVETTLLELARQGLAITAYVSDPSSLAKRLGSRITEDRNAIELRCLPDLDVDEPGPSVDTMVVVGRSDEIIGWDGFLDRTGRLAGTGGRLVLVLPCFSDECSKDDGFDFSSFIENTRLSLSPVHLSVADDTLRFVGEFGVPASNAWSGFERGVWPGLLRDGIRSVVAKNRREVAGLQQRLVRLRGLLSSMPYRVGAALVGAANRPATIWRLPRTLWRLYRSSRPRPYTGTESRQRVTFSPLPLPQPDTASVRPVVAAILDTFSDYCLRYELDLLHLTPKHWRREIEASAPVFLLVESAWAGNNGRWRGIIAHNQTLVVNPLCDLLSYCREKGITTVFWNKEDPPSFDFFIAAARQFDLVFTSDADCVARYEEACGHNRVHVLPFAAQPKIHNPCRDPGWPRYPVCFAGSWRGEAYAERRASISMLLDPALEFGLHIMDRYLTGTATRPGFRFPDRYQEAIKGSLTYSEMLTAYRCYDVMLNANSVTESPTMFSRRVFETLACATPVVSLESAGMVAMLGEHVRVTRCPEETSAHLQALLADNEARAREGHLAYRHVHTNHTYRHRVATIMQTVGARPAPRPASTVTVLGVLRDPVHLECLAADYRAQTYGEKHLLVVVDNEDIDVGTVELALRKVPNAKAIRFGARTFGERLNRAVEEAAGRYIVMFDAAHGYCERYIEDMLLAADFTGAALLGKGSYYSYDDSLHSAVLRNEGKDHTFVESVTMSTIVARRAVLQEIRFEPESGDVGGSLSSRVAEAGLPIYSADRFNYLEVRSNDIGALTSPSSPNGPKGVLAGQRRVLALSQVSL